MRYMTGFFALAVIAAAPLSAPAPALAGRYTSMRAALKNLIVLEERYYAGHGTYTTDQAALGVTIPRTHAESVQPGYSIEIVQAGGRGWWAQAQLADPTPSGCVVFVGELKYSGVTPTTPGGTPVGSDHEGRIACDAP